MLGLEKFLDRMAKASSMLWYGHVLRREDNNVLLKALHFKLLGRIERRLVLMFFKIKLNLKTDINQHLIKELKHGHLAVGGGGCSRYSQFRREEKQTSVL